jgi:hypothetical protein
MCLGGGVVYVGAKCVFILYRLMGVQHKKTVSLNISLNTYFKIVIHT